MKKLQKTSELLWLMGILFVALGITILNKTNLGVTMIAAPAFILSEALLPFSPFFSVGVVEYLNQAIILIVLCIILRKFNWKYLLAFAVAVMYGYVLDFFLWLAKDIEITQLWLRWILLFVGSFSVSFGVACFFRTYLPKKIYEVFVGELVKHFRFDINKTKMAFDMTLLGISIVLAFTLFGDVATFDWSTIGTNSFHSMGLGTLVTTFINAPMIKVFGKLLDKVSCHEPMFKKASDFLLKD
ncbi:MAG: hypothetical protein IJF72_01590 [Clostridia bacterium]|nr:hypothetical protein [Clostridia bacterium]